MTDGLGLGDAYSATLGRIKAQGGEKARLGMAALMWISHAERPLKADELCHALAVEIGSPNLNTDNVPSISTLLACCQGLVVVEKKSSTVRLIHFTLLEYLRAHPDLFGAAHSTMAETCLSFLNSQQVKAFSITPSPNLQDTPFLEYSSLYWGVHAKRNPSDPAKQLALKLFDDYNRHISIKILLKVSGMRRDTMDFDKPFLFSGLHCASFFGIVEIVASLAEMESCDINQADFTGNAPLHWAAFNGHSRVVETLLRRDGISPDKPGEGGQTPLHHAAARGHEGAAKALLGRDGVSSDKPDNRSQTPLWWAASNGHAGVVKMLLEWGDVNPDKPNYYGGTPLFRAACEGHEGAVKILLGRGDVDPNQETHGGLTPLWCAACYGHEGVVRMLLERDDINPNKHRDGQTPLRVAVNNRHEGVVKILLERADVIPDICGGGGTPLHIAVSRRHLGIVKLLLRRDDINPNKFDKDGKTPLDRAIRQGYQAAIALLQPRESTTPSLP